MPPPDSAPFLAHLTGIFRVEALDHLQAMGRLVHELEQATSAAQQAPLLETLFREVHSLKGAARSVNQQAMEAVCTVLENQLALLRRRGTGLSREQLKTVQRQTDALSETLAGMSPVQGGPPPEAPAPPAPALARTAVVPPSTPPAPPGKPADAAAPPLPVARKPDGTVRVSTARLGALLTQVEALRAFKFSASHVVDELQALQAGLDAWKKSAAKSAQNAPFPRPLTDRLAALQRTAEREQRLLARVVDQLQVDMQQALMQPFAAVLGLLPKLVRDLARDSGKDIEVQLEGAGIEIDRRILEQIKDPLIHLVRNAVDHGVETPAERRRLQKPPVGRISISVTPREGNQQELLIADDGAGIDPDQVQATALKLGLITPEQAQGMAPQALLALVFASGLTTRPWLTDLSGRGLGLAIVQEKVDALGGSVTLASQPGSGTQFRLLLPSTLTNFRGLLVSVGAQRYVLPSRHVERVARVLETSVKTVENREAIELEGQALALVRLGDVLAVPTAAANANADARPGAARLTVLLLHSAGKRMAFVVDAVLGDQEVLVKGLGPQLKRLRHVSGATVLGDGSLVLILSVPDLLKSALKAPPQTLVSNPPADQPAQAPRHKLLVVEDSITSRTLLKGILESAGHEVSTAVDGLEALQLLRSQPFDLVVSDVEMPRMDGFELTTAIRQDAAFSGLPVVLVTALDSREHKERGMAVGASAYIVKSSFDQRNLLDVIRRSL